MSHALRYIVFFLLLCVALFFCDTNISSLTNLRAQALSKAQLEKEKSSLKAEIERTARELDAVKRNKKSSLAEVVLVQKKLALRRRKINTINAQLAKIDAQIKSQSEDIERLRGSVSKLNHDYRESIIMSYKFYNKYNPTLYILNTDNFSLLIDHLNYLKSFRSLRSVTLSQVRTTHRMLENEIVRLSATKSSQSQVLSEQEGEFGILRQEEKEKREVLQQLKANEKKLASTLRAKQQRWDKIRRLIQAEIKKEIARNKQKMLADARRKKAQARTAKPAAPQTAQQKAEQKERASSVLTFSDKDYKLAKSFVENKGRLPWPIDGYITMNFGKNTIAEGSHISYNNSGITLHARGLRKPIRAVYNGVVTSVQYMDGGMLITIRHGRYWSIYTPVYNPTVKPNQDVKTGEIIGYSGSAEHTAELEFQLMRETVFLNPQLWLKKM